MNTLQKHLGPAMAANPRIGVSVDQGRFNIVDSRKGPDGRDVHTTLLSDLTGQDLLFWLDSFAEEPYPIDPVSGLPHVTQGNIIKRNGKCYDETDREVTLDRYGRWIYV